MLILSWIIKSSYTALALKLVYWYNNFVITSEIVKIKFTNDNEEIKRELKSIGILPLRWAIVDVSDNELTLSVAYEC